MPSSFRMVMHTGPSVGKVYTLDQSEMSIGRDLSNEIVVNDPEISRRHARLVLQGSGFLIEDLGSTNGTFVNGQRLIGPYALHPGDTITFGEQLSMIFEGSADPDATMVSPAMRPSDNAVQTPPMTPVSRAQDAYYSPAPQPSVYANQIPDPYLPEPPAAPAPRRNMRMWLIAAIILVLMCICLSVFLWVAPRAFWCMLPIWPTGACP